jgi:hypothetical protein
MKRTMMTFLLATAFVLGIGSCGSGSSGPPATLNGACNDMGGSFCQAGLRCNPGTMTQSQCVSAFVSGCCGNDGTCGEATPATDATKYQQCKDSLANMTCADVSSATLPTACSSI